MHNKLPPAAEVQEKFSADEAAAYAALERVNKSTNFLTRGVAKAVLAYRKFELANSQAELEATSGAPLS